MTYKLKSLTKINNIKYSKIDNEIKYVLKSITKLKNFKYKFIMLKMIINRLVSSNFLC